MVVSILCIRKRCREISTHPAVLSWSDFWMMNPHARFSPDSLITLEPHLNLAEVVRFLNLFKPEFLEQPDRRRVSRTDPCHEHRIGQYTRNGVM